MERVTKNNPCPICEKPDWCLYAEDGSAAICQRIQDGSAKRCGDSGWLHVLSNRHNRHNGHRRQPRRHLLTVPAERQSRDFRQLTLQYRQQLTSEGLNWLSNDLGVSSESLQRLQVGWDGQASTFPMRNAKGRVIGIRRRFPGGLKVSVTGSMNGLFIPTDLSPEGLLLISEGPSDTASALDLGFDAIGRPNCNSKVDRTAHMAKSRNVVIIGDNDDGGRSGVERLSDTLVLCCKSVRIIYPPDHIKDLRDWVSIGLTVEKLTGLISDTDPIKIKVHFKRIS